MSDPQFFKHDGNYVHFEWQPTKNEKASEEAGRPIFDKTLIVYVTSPGLTKTVPTFWIKRVSLDGKTVINREYAARYKEQIDKFEATEVGGKMEGTPLDELPFLDVHTRAMLKAHHIYTAEALAELSESGVSEVGMGARTWKNQATAWIEKAQGGAPIARLTADNEKQKVEIERLTALVADLGAKFDRLAEKPKKEKQAA